MKMSFCFQSRVVQLAKGFVGYYSNRICQIERSLLWKHRYPDAFVRVLHQNLFRYSCTFLTEHDVITILEMYI